MKELVGENSTTPTATIKRFATWRLDIGRGPPFWRNLRQLHPVAGSCAVNNASVVVGRELKEGVASFEEESNVNLPMEVNVETLDRGFRINVYSERSCPGLLVSILEAFEELGLKVQDATVSCSDNFSLEAVGEQEDEDESIDARAVKQAVLQAIKSWSEDQKG
ncbi:hypothetical protein MLD38_029970 [Melastoma candidum]|uniref:Uncharacterized protein n=1 Tax=Melastoma candidum TaxID=119954 RepID=A0ACB9MLI0_9MYRT|nr:hypothetical protein MLD38_029970 [Melastoma candidum]